MAGFCEEGNKTSFSIKYGEFLVSLRTFSLSNKSPLNGVP